MLPRSSQGAVHSVWRTMRTGNSGSGVTTSPCLAGTCRKKPLSSGRSQRSSPPGCGWAGSLHLPISHRSSSLQNRRQTSIRITCPSGSSTGSWRTPISNPISFGWRSRTGDSGTPWSGPWRRWSPRRSRSPARTAECSSGRPFPRAAHPSTSSRERSRTTSRSSPGTRSIPMGAVGTPCGW